MVLPFLLIGGAILAAIVIGGGGHNIAEGFNRLTKSGEQKALDTKKDQFEYEKSRLSIWDNFVRTAFTGYGDLENPGRETVNAPKTEGRAEGLATYRPTARTRNYRRRNWLR